MVISVLISTMNCPYCSRYHLNHMRNAFFEILDLRDKMSSAVSRVQSTRFIKKKLNKFYLMMNFEEKINEQNFIKR